LAFADRPGRLKPSLMIAASSCYKLEGRLAGEWGGGTPPALAERGVQSQLGGTQARDAGLPISHT